MVFRDPLKHSLARRERVRFVGFVRVGVGRVGVDFVRGLGVGESSC